MENKLKNLTILVNSCDAYKDLWDPFFKLFNVYGGELKNCQIVLNADKEQYTYPGLNIICPNKYQTIEPWGKRVKNCLKAIKTDYVLELLDDFFLQRECDVEMIKQCIDWLDSNKKIGAFNLLSLKESEQESKEYVGFCYIKPNKKYRLNSQACIWRKSIFDRSLLENESPWDWETLGNIRNSIILKDYDFYCISEKYPEPYFYNSEFCNKKYSPDIVRNAVIRGKWDLSCIDNCFKQNDIKIDYSIRGIYTPPKPVTKHPLILIKKIFKRLFRPFSKKYKELVTNPIKQYKKINKIKEQ